MAPLGMVTCGASQVTANGPRCPPGATPPLIGISFAGTRAPCSGHLHAAAGHPGRPSIATSRRCQAVDASLPAGARANILRTRQFRVIRDTGSFGASFKGHRTGRTGYQQARHGGCQTHGTIWEGRTGDRRSSGPPSQVPGVRKRHVLATEGPAPHWCGNILQPRMGVTQLRLRHLQSLWLCPLVLPGGVKAVASKLANSRLHPTAPRSFCWVQLAVSAGWGARSARALSRSLASSRGSPPAGTVARCRR